MHSHIRKEKSLSTQIHLQAFFVYKYEAIWPHTTSLLVWSPERIQLEQVSSLLSTENVHSCWHRKQCKQTIDTA